METIIQSLEKSIIDMEFSKKAKDRYDKVSKEVIEMNKATSQIYERTI